MEPLPGQLAFPNPWVGPTSAITRENTQFYAQDIRTGEWLHRDIEFSNVQITWGPRGDYVMRAMLEPVMADMLRPVDGQPIFKEWGTAIYAEENNFDIIWGGIYDRGNFVEGQYELDVIGYSQYLDGTPYLGEYSQVGVDPADVYRELWNHAQSYGTAKLGVAVGGQTTKARLGTTEEPYTLFWWDRKDMGSVADRLMEETPFDTIEKHRWVDSSKEEVLHTIDIGWPRVGRKRNDLIGRFSSDTNLRDVVSVTRDGQEYADSVFFLGSGEGSRRKHFPLEAASDTGRVRRARMIDDPRVSSEQEMERLARAAVKSFAAIEEIRSVRVTDDAADLITPGDDILVQAETAWLGQVEIWSRVMGITRSLDEVGAQLDLVRADTFLFGGNVA